MGFIIGLLTVIMVLDCAVLALLVLIQLPKKEAGAGLAFGGAASDALFGAGSGNVLTKITKYAAGIFIVLAIFVSAAQSHYNNKGSSGFQIGLSSGPTQTQPPGPGTDSGTPVVPAPSATNQPAPQSETPSTTPASTNK